MLDAALSGLLQVLSPDAMGLMLIGIAIGFAVGVLPGLGGAVTMALMLPFTYGMQPIQAFAFLLGMKVVTSTTGDVTSVLFGIPGEPTSAATVLDGHPMARKGQAGRALGIVLASSLFGAIIGALVLAASIPFIRPIVLAFGPPEFFMLTVVGLTFIASLSQGQMVKGMLLGVLGLMLALVGIDPQAGVPRYTFGYLELWDGIDIIPIVIGLFGGPEILQLMLSKNSIASSGNSQKIEGVGAGLIDTLRHWKSVITAGAIGAGIGVIPGVGGSVAQFIAYGHAKQVSKTPEEFGKGSVEGLIAAAGNNNAKESGSLVPMIAFGLPGSVSTAILLNAFLVTGINPGPEMLTTHLDVTFSMVWIAIIANIIVVLIALPLLRPLARLTFTEGPVLVPFLIILVVLGAYSENNSMMDVWVMLGAAVFGVICLRWNWPRVPLLLGLVLGDLCERYLFLSNSLYGWSWVQRPLVLLFAAMTLLIFIRAGWHGVKHWRQLRREHA
ncbi:Tripartite tricarboxylate transporter TctA family protein [Hartmannibacter diazotrophicus]|uniref:Tripartite tricarboxylate transporter TctA family protein n=1 Tax=Hartmannibacter diazotrophicus TaxID=1482074 RepID=A0A2C9D254_9HYPH|nr:tripartite tricarboxylate transporter permease [Hartmannibacter diazotrophicus]SON53881.1 Tripartite tricarboxylate transporter TctA family protein [Hartmannibacter diazotrophicus]